MFLFKPYFVDAICKRRKTQTRRNHKRARARVGSIHQCRTELFGEPFAWVRMTRVWQQRVCDITQEEVNAEGLAPMTPAEFVEGFIEIARGKVTPETTVYCYEFQLLRKASDATPAEIVAEFREQKRQHVAAKAGVGE